MSTLILAVFLTGALLGIRFKVLVLIPATGFVMIAVVCVGILRSDSASTVFLQAMLVWSCLQMGYVCGVALAHIGHPRKMSLQTNYPTRAS